MATVTLEGVSKTYPDGFRAVKDLDLVVEDESMVVFVGPSGCGKSTTLRMIAGLEEPSGGVISIGDTVANRLAPNQRDVAMVFQNYALYPHMTVFENMAFALKLRGVPRTVIREKVAEAAALLGLGPLLGRKPAALSGGQRQRVAVGRAIVRTPKCFLFDEPLSNLDARLRGEMRVELRQLHQRLRTTSIYVTHDQEEAMTLGDKVAVMKDGVLQQYDTPLSIYEHPANRFVASFVGTPSMGFLPGRLRFGDGRPRFEAAGVDWPLPAAPPPLPDGAPVVLGVRPQAFREAPAGDRADAARLPVVLELVEHLGAQMDLSFTLAGVRLTARVDARAGLRVGAALDLFVDTRKLHLFDAESGHSLDPRHGARRPA